MDYSKYEGHTPGKWGREDKVNKETITAGKDKTGAFIYTGIDLDLRVNFCNTLKERNANYALVIDAPALLAHCKELETRLESAEFWQGVYPDGWTKERVEAEMSDFRFMMDSVPQVYMAVTGGLISKPNTMPDAVIGVYEQHITERIEQETKEIRDKVKELEGLLKELVSELDGIDNMDGLITKAKAALKEGEE